MSNNPHSLLTHGWGYYLIDPLFKGNDFRTDCHPLTFKDKFDLTKSYMLVGCEPETMFKPGTEPNKLDFFWWDNTLLPWLRYISAANKDGHKLWSRITYRGWNMPSNSLLLEEHRKRVNERLHHESNGLIKDIQDLWGGCRSTKSVKKKHALIVSSSERNHKEFYNETQVDWILKVVNVLKEMGYTFGIRKKVPVYLRHGNQIVDEMRNGGYDLLIGNHTASTSEAVVLGYPVITTSENNPARDVSTHWEDFIKGKIKQFDHEQINNWVTRICAYTYWRDEINDLSWIDVHPQAGHLKDKRYKRA